MFSTISPAYHDPGKGRMINHDSTVEKKMLQSAQLGITFSTPNEDDDDEDLDDEQEQQQQQASLEYEVIKKGRASLPSTPTHRGQRQQQTPVRPNFQAAQNRFILYPASPPLKSPPASVSAFRHASAGQALSPPPTPRSAPATATTTTTTTTGPVTSPRTSAKRALPTPRPRTTSEAGPGPTTLAARNAAAAAAAESRSKDPETSSSGTADYSSSEQESIASTSPLIPKALPSPPINMDAEPSFPSSSRPMSQSPPSRPLPGPPRKSSLATPLSSAFHKPVSLPSTPTANTSSAPSTPKPTLRMLQIPPSSPSPPPPHRHLPNQPYTMQSISAVVGSTPTPSTGSTNVPTPRDEEVPPMPVAHRQAEKELGRQHNIRRKDIFSLSNPIPKRGRLLDEESLMGMSPISPDGGSGGESVYSFDGTRTRGRGGRAGLAASTPDSGNDDDGKSMMFGGHPMELDGCDDASSFIGSEETALGPQSRQRAQQGERRGRSRRHVETEAEVPVFLSMASSPKESEVVPQSAISESDGFTFVSPICPPPAGVKIGVLGPVGVHDQGESESDKSEDDEDGKSSVRSLSPIRYARRSSTGEDTDTLSPSSPLHFAHSPISDSEDEEDRPDRSFGGRLRSFWERRPEEQPSSSSVLPLPPLATDTADWTPRPTSIYPGFLADPTASTSTRPRSISLDSSVNITPIGTPKPRDSPSLPPGNPNATPTRKSFLPAHSSHTSTITTYSKDLPSTAVDQDGDIDYYGQPPLSPPSASTMARRRMASPHASRIGISAGAGGLSLRSPPSTVTSFHQSQGPVPGKGRAVSVGVAGRRGASRSPPKGFGIGGGGSIPVAGGVLTPSSSLASTPITPASSSKLPTAGSGSVPHSPDPLQRIRPHQPTISSSAPKAVKMHSRKSLSVDSIHVPIATSSLSPGPNSNAVLLGRKKPSSHNFVPVLGPGGGGGKVKQMQMSSFGSAAVSFASSPPSAITHSNSSPSGVGSAAHAPSVAINSVPASIDAITAGGMRRSRSIQRSGQGQGQGHSSTRGVGVKRPVAGGGVVIRAPGAGSVNGGGVGAGAGGGSGGMKQVTWTRPTVFHSPTR